MTERTAMPIPHCRCQSILAAIFLLASVQCLWSGLLVDGHILPHANSSLHASPEKQTTVNNVLVEEGAIYSRPLQFGVMMKKHKSRRHHHHPAKGSHSRHVPKPSSRNTSRHLPPGGAANPPSRNASRHLRPGDTSPSPAGMRKSSHGQSPSERPKHVFGPSVPPKTSGSAVSPGSAPPKTNKNLPTISSPVASPPKNGESCEQTSCSDPFTSTPIGSPCGCVLPIRVELKLSVAPYAVFPLIVDLEIEVAAATYLKQSQVKIMGADADKQDQEKTIVNIDLVPLGEKFDNATALLIYERFWQKKVTINTALFGDYQVVFVNYTGLPTSPTVGPGAGSISGGPNSMFGGGGAEQPFSAKVTNRKTKMSHRMIAVIVLSSFIALLICLGAVWLLLWKCKKYPSTSPAAGAALTSSIAKRSGIRSILSSSMGSSMSMSLISSVAPCMLSVKTFSLAELQRATDDFSHTKVLGEGGFGRVYHGVLEDRIEVAVKVLTKDNQHGDREFISEVEMLSRLHHRNLVKLVGICIEEHNRCLVYELIPNGSVESHLHGADKQKGPLDWDARMKIALGAARGLAYLHEDSNPRVIHRDFKASNVLLEKDFTPKVSDFGLAKEASDGSQHISTRVMGTFGYVAPEYAMTGHLLVKSDVYSYGVVLLELLSGRRPVDMSKPTGQENLVTWARPLLTSQEGLEQLVDPFLFGRYNFDNMARVAAIASMCVHPEVSQRPFMGEVVQALKLVYNDVDEACEDCHSQREDSSGPDHGYEHESTPENNWWERDASGASHGYNSSFITTMEYSSDPLDIVGRPGLASTFFGNRILDLRGSPSRWQNRSCPVIRSKPSFYRLRGSMSEHGFLAMRLGMNRPRA